MIYFQYANTRDDVKRIPRRTLCRSGERNSAVRDGLKRADDRKIKKKRRERLFAPRRMRDFGAIRGASGLKYERHLGRV